jgi:hypothetical protein
MWLQLIQCFILVSIPLFRTQEDEPADCAFQTTLKGLLYHWQVLFTNINLSGNMSTMISVSLEVRAEESRLVEPRPAKTVIMTFRI